MSMWQPRDQNTEVNSTGQCRYSVRLIRAFYSRYPVFEYRLQMWIYSKTKQYERMNVKRIEGKPHISEAFHLSNAIQKKKFELVTL